MKTRLTRTTLALCALVLAPAALAQRGEGRAPRPQRQEFQRQELPRTTQDPAREGGARLERLRRRFDALTDEQRQELRHELRERVQRRRAGTDANDGRGRPGGARRPDPQALRQRLDEALGSGRITPDQHQRIQQRLQELGTRRRAGGPDAAGIERPGARSQDPSTERPGARGRRAPARRGPAARGDRGRRGPGLRGPGRGDAGRGGARREGARQGDARPRDARRPGSGRRGGAPAGEDASGRAGEPPRPDAVRRGPRTVGRRGGR